MSQIEGGGQPKGPRDIFYTDGTGRCLVILNYGVIPLRIFRSQCDRHGISKARADALLVRIRCRVSVEQFNDIVRTRLPEERRHEIESTEFLALESDEPHGQDDIDTIGRHVV